MDNLFNILGSAQTMDLSALGRMFVDDTAAGMVPLLVVGEVGTSICGHNDNVSRLQDLCRTHNVWLHLRGHGLAAIAVTQATGVVSNLHIISNFYSIFSNKYVS